MKRIPAEYAATPEATTINPSRHGLDGLVLVGYSRFRKMREPTEEHIHPGLLEIGFCERKSMVLNASGVDYQLMPGDFFVNQPNSTHHLMSRPSGLALHYLMLSRPKGKPLLALPKEESAALWRKLTKLPPVVSSGKYEAHVSRAFSQLFRLSPLPESPWTSLMMRQLLLSILTSAIKRSEEERGIDRQMTSITQIADLIRQNPDKPFTVCELARKAGLSQTHFINLFRRKTGLPPVKFQIECRIQRSKELLLEPGRTISDIALQLGFNSHQHFTDTFSRIVGIPPIRWRQKVQKCTRQLPSVVKITPVPRTCL